MNGLPNGGAAHQQQSPPYADENDFLEMDFVDSGDDGDSDDSGQGGDENVTETNEEDESEVEAPQNNNVDGAHGGHDLNPWGAPPPPPLPLHSTRQDKVPDTLAFAERGEKSKSSASSHRRPCVISGVTSAPAVTPVSREDLSLMVRSRSLNSPLDSARCPALMARGESDPAVSRAVWMGGGDPRAGPSFDPVVNMEVCGTRLSQREALLFQVPPPSPVGEEEALVRSDRAGRTRTLVLVLIDMRLLTLHFSAANLTEAARSLITEKTMVWTEQEACQRHVTQVGTSACGATAVINALSALNGPSSLLEAADSSAEPVPFTPEGVCDAVRTRLRAERAPLPEYLFSRSRAGCTADDLVRATEAASGSTVRARFFPLHPRRRVHLSSWLQHWLRRGAVPILTINPQRAALRPGQATPDAWHHQMVFGVGPAGIYLTNPLMSSTEAALMPQLCSPSVLLVRRSDVLLRFRPSDELAALASHPDPRWDRLNVLGQVVNVLREEAVRRESGGAASGGAAGTAVPVPHVSVPAEYRSGVTLLLRRSSPHLSELEQCPDLPLIDQYEEEPPAGNSLPP